MSPKQTSLYWRTWSALCDEFDWRHNETARRYALHAEAGCPQSSRDWDNTHFDKFLAHSRALLAGKPPTGERINEEAGARRRLEWRIRQDLRAAHLDVSYVAKLATDMYGLGCWTLLALDQLQNLRDTVHNRTQTARTVAKANRPQARRTAPAKPRQTSRTATPAGVDCPF